MAAPAVAVYPAGLVDPEAAVSTPWRWLAHQWRTYDRGPFVAAGIILAVVALAVYAAVRGPR